MTRRELLVSLAALPAAGAQRPKEYEGALRNPLMGFRPGMERARAHKWATLGKHYIRWNEIETRADNGVEKIREFCGAKWKALPETNIKVIPRVYLEWPKRGKYWPAGMTEGDYTSAAFKDRLARLVEKLGEKWDNDPRGGLHRDGPDRLLG